MRPRTPTRRCRSISRVNRRPISTGWRLLRNGLANVPSTRRSSRSSNCWSPMVSQRLLVRCPQHGFDRRLTWLPVPLRSLGASGGRPASDYCCPVTRASGGIGRRAGFRFLCPKGCGGSSPPSPTQNRAGARAPIPALRLRPGTGIPAPSCSRRHRWVGSVRRRTEARERDPSRVRPLLHRPRPSTRLRRVRHVPQPGRGLSARPAPRRRAQPGHRPGARRTGLPGGPPGPARPRAQ